MSERLEIRLVVEEGTEPLIELNGQPSNAALVLVGGSAFPSVLLSPPQTVAELAAMRNRLRSADDELTAQLIAAIAADAAKREVKQQNRKRKRNNKPAS